MGNWIGTVPSFASGQELAASDQRTMIDILTAATSAQTLYTPVWTTAGTAPSLGNGTLTGGYTQLGQNGLIFFRISLLAGSTTTFGTLAWSFTLPTNVAQPAFMDYAWTGTVTDAGTATYPAHGLFSGPASVTPCTGSPNASITNVSPMTWNAAGPDRLYIAGWYWGA